MNQKESFMLSQKPQSKEHTSNQRVLICDVTILSPVLIVESVWLRARSAQKAVSVRVLTGCLSSKKFNVQPVAPCAGSRCPCQPFPGPRGWSRAWGPELVLSSELLGVILTHKWLWAERLGFLV